MTAADTKPRPRKGYWYKHYVTECPVCGRGEHVRERQYSEPPPKYSPERWDYAAIWDYCGVL